MNGNPHGDRRPPRHGELGYAQLPARDLAASAVFYREVFGWSTRDGHPEFTAPGLIGQWVTDQPPAPPGTGAVIWICADDLYPTLSRVEQHGGRVHSRPRRDGGARWLADVDDPAGNHIGVFVLARTTAPQTLIAVRDVEASSRWYQQLLGLRSEHGGPHYERLTADGTLVMQLHHSQTEHDHGRIGDPDRQVGNGVLLWFGETSDFDGVVERAERLGAPVVLAPHRNPPEGTGNGPGHREIWITDPDGYTVVVASPDGEAFEPTPQANAPSAPGAA
jgi:predicted enzyme related to lactoylglutathione lyase